MMGETAQRVDGRGTGPRPTNPAEPDNAIQRVREELERADREFFERAVRAIGETHEPDVTYSVEYPDLELEGPLEEAGRGGWEETGALIVAVLWANAARIVGATPGPVRGPAPPGKARTAEEEAVAALVAAEEGAPAPMDAIAKYVAERIPPLKYELKDQRRQLCRDIVADALRQGKGTGEIMSALEREGFGRSEWHREIIARTDTMTLWNWGAVARYRASGAVIGVHYEAIMDDRTCERCQYLDGHVFRLDDIAGITPPIHYSCRCVLRPILWFEAKDMTWSDPRQMIAAADAETRPLPGFGTVRGEAYMPEVQGIEEFLRPLTESEREELREIARRIKERWAA